MAQLDNGMIKEAKVLHPRHPRGNDADTLLCEHVGATIIEV